MDILETPEEVIVQAEIPGIDAKEIEISLSGRLLTISGEKKSDYDSSRVSCCRVERGYGPFFRSIELPVEVDSKEITASYENGVLKIHMPKTKENPIKKIEVKLL